jgi:hypothetical protein
MKIGLVAYYRRQTKSPPISLQTKWIYKQIVSAMININVCYAMLNVLRFVCPNFAKYRPRLE